MAVAGKLVTMASEAIKVALWLNRSKAASVTFNCLRRQAKLHRLKKFIGRLDTARKSGRHHSDDCFVPHSFSHLRPLSKLLKESRNAFSGWPHSKIKIKRKIRLLPYLGLIGRDLA